MKHLMIAAMIAIGAGSAMSPHAALAEDSTPPINKKVAFQNLTFGDRPEMVRKKLKAYKVVSGDDTTTRFSGEIGSKDAEIVTVFSPVTHRLWKVNVYFTPSSQDSVYELKTALNEYKQILINKYGPPSDSYEFFSKPYFEGDGYETQAIRVGKGTFAHFWMLADGSIQCQIDKSLKIHIGYEHKEMSALDDKERAEGLQNGL